MAGAVMEWRATAPADIDAALPELWREAAREGPISRALMSNLVIVRHRSATHDDNWPGVEPNSDILRIAERHPARIILLHYSPSSTRPCAPAKASIGVLTFGAATMRYGVEVIAVDAVCAEASVPSIVRRLTRGDVPTTMWWTEDLSRARPPFALVETARQLVYDSSQWQDVAAGARAASDMLALPHAPDLADLNWHGLAALRWALVHASGTEPRLVLSSPAAAVIRHRPGASAAAWLIAAWLQRSLNWSTPPAVQPAAADAIVTVALTGEAGTIEAAMRAERVDVTCGGRPPFSIAVPAQSTSDAVVAELESLGRDMYLRETMLTLASPTR